MKRLVILSFAAALVLTACAAADSTEDDNGGDGDLPGREAAVTDPAAGASNDGSEEALPEEPSSGYDAEDLDPLPRIFGTSETASTGGDGSSTDDAGSEIPIGDLPGIVRLAVERLAAHLGPQTDSIHWVSHQGVTWPDSSIGCPQKGMSYTQVLTSGTLTILEANGIQYRYHAGPSGDPFLCMTPTDPLPPGSGGDT